MIEIVSATRVGEEDFWKRTALGVSLRRLAFEQRIVPSIAFGNTAGLPEIYNRRIHAPDGREVLVFIHDDVWIDDCFLAERVLEGLERFDVIGVAGNRRRADGQPAWAFLDNPWRWDERENLSGRICSGKMPFGAVAAFGSSPAECELLDGVFLAARRGTLLERGVAFDPAFDFHFYDLDFCRTARQKGLRLGTWPICLTHQSGGSFRSNESWRRKRALYESKWVT